MLNNKGRVDTFPCSDDLAKYLYLFGEKFFRTEMAEPCLKTTVLKHERKRPFSVF